MGKGLIFIVSAPSGAGKTSIIHKAMRSLTGLKFSVSCTTRERRKREVDGIDYHFISKQEFEEKIKKGEFAEWAKVHNHYYGTLKKEIKSIINNGNDCLLDIDVNGGVNIQKLYPEAVSIFIIPPSFHELEVRLKNRHTEDSKSIKVRLKNAKKELAFYKYYNYIIVNDSLKESVKDFISIIKSEKLRTKNFYKIPKILRGVSK